jgi:hypothetical protein
MTDLGARCRNSVFARLAPGPEGLSVRFIHQPPSGSPALIGSPIVVNPADIIELRFTVLTDTDPTQRWIQTLAFAVLGSGQTGGTVQVDATTATFAGLWNLQSSPGAPDALQGVVSALSATGPVWGNTLTPDFIGLANQQGGLLQTNSPAPWFTIYANHATVGWALLAAPGATAPSPPP